MAVQVETQGQLQDLLELLRRRAWLVILPAMFVITLGSSFAVLVPKKYVVRTQVELRETILDSIFGGRGTVPVSTREAANAAWQIRSLQRIKGVLKELEWPDYLALDRMGRHEYERKIQENIKVRVPKRKGGVGSTYVTIEFMDPNPTRAEHFLNELRDAWIDDVVQRDRNALQKKKNTEGEEKARLETQFRAQNMARSELMSKNGISPIEHVAGGLQADDPVMANLNNIRIRLQEVRGLLKTNKADHDWTGERLRDAPPKISKEIIVAGESYETELSELERKIEERKQERDRYRPTYHKYVKLDNTIAGLQREKDELRQKQRASTTQLETIDNPKLPLLREALTRIQGEGKLLKVEEADLVQNEERYDQKVKELHEVYRDLKDLNLTIGILEEQLTRVTEAYDQTKKHVQMISGPEGSPFMTTEEVVPPRKPSEPNPWLIVAFSVFAGIGLGVGLAFLSEYSSSSFRSVHDISRVMVVPVLGAINTIMTSTQQRRRRAQKFVVGFSSFVLIGAVVFVTWAWSFNPDLLTQEMREVIEQVRAQFR